MTPLTRGSPTAAHARAAQGGHQIDVEPAGDHHLHHVERGRVGDPPPADQARLQPQACRQRRHLRPAAVDDDQPPRRAPPRAMSRGDRGQRGALQHVATQLDDGATAGRRRGRYGHGPGSSSDIVSGRPSIRFMFWIAWPAPPLIRLSVALTTASVRVGDRRLDAPSVKPTSA